MDQARPEEDTICVNKLCLIVPKQYTKTFKTALEAQNVLDKSRKITTANNVAVDGPRYSCLLTTVTSSVEVTLSGLLETSLFQDLVDKLSVTKAEPLLSRAFIESVLDARTTSQEISFSSRHNQPNALAQAVQAGLEAVLHRVAVCSPGNGTLEHLLQDFTKSYTIYSPLLLLPGHVSKTKFWAVCIAQLSTPQRRSFFETIAKRMTVSHVALNAPIPAWSSPLPPEEKADVTEDDCANVLRRPINITPLYGDFGSLKVDPQHPRLQDLGAAFWVSTRQSSIHYMWAPLHTMFSRGNIREKQRLLSLNSVKQAVDQGRQDGRGCSAVDLYAGIGYFAFCYLKAGVDWVAGWDLNGWSVEGARRGAIRNGWGVTVIRDQDGPGDVDGKCATGRDGPEGKERLRLFHESNEDASERTIRLRSAIPPIRHVNCGLLPTSSGSWRTALEVLDPDLGGWIHVHENIAAKDIMSKSGEILATISYLAGQASTDERGASSRGRPTLEHVERVKSYAPGVVHCVLDIYIPPAKNSDVP